MTYTAHAREERVPHHVRQAMRMIEKIRPLVFLGIVLVMVLGVSSAALADEPAVEEQEAPSAVEVAEDEVIPRTDDERPPAVEPAVEPEPEEPMVIAPADGIEEPMIVNPEGTIGIEENLISPTPTSESGGRQRRSHQPPRSAPR